MALHYLNPDDAPCQECANWNRNPSNFRTTGCARCDGNAIGNPDGPKVETQAISNDWRFKRVGRWPIRWNGPYPTESAALDAARKAWKDQ